MSTHLSSYRTLLEDLVILIGDSADVSLEDADNLPEDAPPPEGVGDEIWLIIKSKEFLNARKKLERA